MNKFMQLAIEAARKGMSTNMGDPFGAVMRTFIFALLILLAAPLFAEPQVLKEWNFNADGQREGWTGNNHLKDITVAGGSLRAGASGVDPFIVLNEIDIPALPSHVFEFRLKTNYSGSAELFFTSTTEGPYGGFSPQKIARWEAAGDGEFHVYRIFPNWSSEERIIKLRLDFPNLPRGDISDVQYELDWIRIVDLNFAEAPAVKPDWNFASIRDSWIPLAGSKVEPGTSGWKISGTIESQPITLDIDEHGTWISLELAVDKGKTATVEFLSSNGTFSSVNIPLKADGRSRWYNVDASVEPAWKDKIHLLRLKVSDERAATAMLKRLVISDDPQGPAEVEVLHIHQTEAINRTGIKRPLAIRLRNNGGQTSKDIKIAKLTLPSGVSVVSPRGWEAIPDLEPLQRLTSSKFSRSHPWTMN